CKILYINYLRQKICLFWVSQTPRPIFGGVCPAKKESKRGLRGTLSIVFYDVTTPYFEIEQEDELRRTGFSKEGKQQHPQILLGLLVSVDAYPLTYEIFEDNAPRPTPTCFFNSFSGAFPEAPFCGGSRSPLGTSGVNPVLYNRRGT
ncbi:MAG: hypothetical protein RL013_723, partial [Bacteroidota bacterium]